MTTDHLIAIIGLLATWITVVIVYFSLREMAAQRKQSYKPCVVVLPKSCYVYIKKYGEYYFPDIWSELSLEKEAISKEIVEDQIYVDLVNVGLGAAKEIELEWVFDLRNTINELIDVYSKYSIPIKIGFLSPDLFSVMMNHSYISGVVISNDLKSFHEYLSPTTISGEKLKINIPFTILMITSLRMHAWRVCQEDEFLRKLWGFEYFKLKIKYNDISNMKHESIFEGEIRILSASKGHDENGQKAFSAYIQFSDSSKKDSKTSIAGFS